MAFREIESRTVLLKHKKIDSWFLSRYGMNLYRGCPHNCAYCDGRAEKYGVEGEFGKDAAAKVNAIAILKKELDPRRRRKPFNGGYFMIGGGVGDSYQPMEERYMLTRGALSLMHRFNHPVHILTKSRLVERDIEIIKKINGRKGGVVSFSFSTLDDELGSIFEPGASLPSERLASIKKFKGEGVPCGIFLLPVIPFITDDMGHIKAVIDAAEDVGADFVIFGGMTLKEGRQKSYFYKELERYYPDLIPEYEKIYQGDRWGNATSEYYGRIENRFQDALRGSGVPPRMPLRLFKDIVNMNDRVCVMLEHMDYLMRAAGKMSSYGKAAYQISKLQAPIERMEDLTSIDNVGARTAAIIEEIIETGTSNYYERLMGPT